MRRARPLVVVFDDLQWAEPTFLDLVDYLADHTRDAPLLLLCVARPELFDIRRDWGGGKRHATTTSLEPLGDDDARRLITNLLGGQPLPAEARDADRRARRGQRAVHRGAARDARRRRSASCAKTRAGSSRAISRDLRVPQEINAFLAARLERLPTGERTLLVRGAVEGALFHYSALRELSPELSESSLHRDLATLVRRDLIRPARSSFSGDDAYRFRHILIRDAAYDSLSKTTRAELHERFATWLERAAGRADPRIRGDRRLSLRAGVPLPQGHRLGGRGSAPPRRERLRAARVGRAQGPRPRRTSRQRFGCSEERRTPGSSTERGAPALLPELGAALIGTGHEEHEAETILAEARRLAAAAGDECADAHAVVQQQILLVFRAEPGAPEEATRAVASVIPIFERYGDEHGLCRAWRLQGLVQWNAARAAASIESRSRLRSTRASPETKTSAARS